MDQTMNAAVLYGKEDVRLESVAVPSIAPGELLVRVRTALTCGTDVKVFRRGYHARMIVPPALFGHEMAGDIVAVGEGVTSFHVGQRVVAANSAPCGACFFCRRRAENLCEDLLFNNGAYAEFIRIPKRIAERNTYAIPPHLRYEDAALVEPLACVLRGLDETAVLPGDTIAVMGLGPIGLMFVCLAKAAFQARVIAIARRRSQIDQAMSLGADEGVLMDGRGLVSGVKRLTEGRGADAVIEAIGLPETWELAVELVRKGGTVNFFGGCPSGTKAGLDTSLLHYSEITCKASFHHTPDHIRRALALVSAGEVSADQLVNGLEPLSSLPDVLRELASSRNGHLKTAIVP
jgi:L-iditol 2-dehydrogenase